MTNQPFTFFLYQMKQVLAYSRFAYFRTMHCSLCIFLPDTLPPYVFLVQTPLPPLNCEFSFSLQGQVYLYYGLSNYYQNHRRYVKSRDDNQLGGKSIDETSDLNGDCSPYKGADVNGSSDSVPYAPCGAIANSLFNGELLSWVL